MFTKPKVTQSMIDAVNEALKGDQHKIDMNKNKKIDAHDFELLRNKKEVKEELKGDQHKIDKNKNNKIDSQDFDILRKQKKETYGEEAIAKIIENSYAKNASKDEPPFTPDPVKKNPSAKAGKFGVQFSVARHLAKQGMKQAMKPVKEESLTAGKRLISKHGEGEHTARVYKDTEYNEYQVHHFKDGKHMGEGPVSYHDDKEDAQSTAEHSLKKRMGEEVEQIDENAMHGTVYLHKYHEGSSEDSYGEVGKNHTQHAYKVYHKKPGEKPKLIGDTENNVHNKTKKTAHAVARNDEMEYDHKSHNDAVRHVMDAAGVHSSTPIRYIKDKKQMNEEVERIDELSTNTLKSYHNKALKDMKAKGEKLGMRSGTKKDWKRIHGMETAKSKMYSKGVDPFKEEVESVTERTLSEPETQEKERIVKGMKKGLQGFKQRYGERAKSVMYATATKLAKEETVQEGENTQVKGGDPCWKGYQMVGMKNKGGKKVPNCVPEETQCDTPMNRTTKIAKAAFEAIKDRTKVK